MSTGRVLMPARRSFLSRVTVGAAAFSAVGGAVRPARAESGAFQPAKHAQDDWLDQLSGKHRFVLDTTTPAAADEVRRFVANFFAGNKSGYGLDPGELAVVVILRHHSTPFAFRDAMWAKYGAAVSEELKFTDPRTSRAPTTNVYNASDNAFDALAERGVHFAVCAMATRFFAGIAAVKSGGNSDAVYQELVANLIGNAHMVPAGIVAVNRAQEHGYSFGFVG